MHLSVQRQSVQLHRCVLRMALEAADVRSPDLDGMESSAVLFPLAQGINLLVPD